MIIRCERCSTLYELDESLLASDGSDVQCTRCQHVFRAIPPRAPGQTLQGVPTQAVVPPTPAPPAAPEPAAPPAASEPPATAAPEPHAVASAHQAPRYAPGPAVYRPPISQPSVSRPPLIRRDTVGTFESRLRWSHRWKWLAPTLIAAVVGLGVLAFLLRDSLHDPRARGAHQAALELASRDDLASLEQARSQLDDAIRKAPRLHAARADRALVDLLTAGALADLSPDPAGGVRGRKGEVLVEQSSASLEQLERAGLAPAEVARARAVAAALGTDRAQLGRLATAARALLADDPFVQVAELSSAVRSGDRGSRERAIGALSMLVTRHPELIRARYTLARGQALAGRRPEALATLKALLEANPRHEGALALRESLVRTTPAVVGPAPVPPSANPAQPAARAERPATPPRRADSSSGEAGAATGGTSASAAPRPSTPAAPRPAQGSTPGAAGSEVPAASAPGDAEPAPVAPRLRPAAVPEPEPVQGGG